MRARPGCGKLQGALFGLELGYEIMTVLETEMFSRRLKQSVTHAVMLPAITALIGCYARSHDVVLPDSETAVISNLGLYAAGSWGTNDCNYCIISIKKENNVYYDKGRDGLMSQRILQPGRYNITYANTYVPYHEVQAVRVERTDTIDVEAGYEYHVVYGYSDEKRHLYIWIHAIAMAPAVHGEHDVGDVFPAR
jgi:hypothetical protein